MALLVCVGLASATETGSFSHRAQKLLVNGQYQDALRMLHMALQSSAKEADYEGEQRVRIDIAQILVHYQEYGLADSLLNTIAEAKLDQRSRLTAMRLRLEMLNQQKQYAKAASYFTERKSQLQDDDPEGVRAAILLEGAVAQVGNGSRTSSINELVDAATDLLDDEGPGMLAFARARISDISGDALAANKLYQKALTSAQKSHQSWRAGQILFRLGELSTNPNDAAEYFHRAAKLYMQLNLDRPFIASAERYQTLTPHDKDLALALSQARERLGLANSNP